MVIWLALILLFLSSPAYCADRNAIIARALDSMSVSPQDVSATEWQEDTYSDGYNELASPAVSEQHTLSYITDSDQVIPLRTFPVRKHTYEIAAQLGYSQYETGDKWPYYYTNTYQVPVSDKVEKEGMLYGLYGAKTWSLSEPLHSWKDFLKRYELPNFIKLEVEGSLGSISYSSFITDTIKGYQAWEMDARVLLGYDVGLNNSILLTPYLGFGFHHSRDEAGGYVDYFIGDYTEFTNRKTYFYIPVGMETLATLNQRWDVGFKLEGDIIVLGTTDYRLDEIPGAPFSGFYDVNTGAPLIVDPKPADSELKGGFGFKTSVKLIRKYNKFDFYLEPFFRFVFLNKSEPAQAHFLAINNGNDYVSVYPDKSAYKPLWDEDNYTMFSGLRTGIQF